MKRLFFILVFINLLVFGLGWLNSAGQTSNVQAREVNASEIRPLGAITLPKASEPAAVASSPAEKPQPTPVAVAGATTPATCLRLAGVTPELITQARSKIKALGISNQETGADSKVWVYIPPLDSQDTARKKAQQIAELGIDDFFVINNGGKWQNAISLGVYSTQEAGEKRLAALKAKGVKSAQLRDKDDTPKPHTFTFGQVAADMREKLEKLSSQLRGTSLQEARCP